MTVVEFKAAIRNAAAGVAGTPETPAELQRRPLHISNPGVSGYQRGDHNRLARQGTFPILRATVETISEAEALVLHPELQTNPALTLRLDGNASPTALELLVQVEALAIADDADVYVRTGDAAVALTDTAVTSIAPTAVGANRARLLAA